MAVTLGDGGVSPPQDVMMKRKRSMKVVEDVGVVNGQYDMAKTETPVVNAAHSGPSIKMKTTPEAKPTSAAPVRTEGPRGWSRVAKSAPPGWAGTVEHMKQKGDIENPFALAWSMKKKGYKPHYADVKKSGIPGCALCLKGAFDAGMLKGGHVLVDELYYQDVAGHVYYMPDSLFKAESNRWSAAGIRYRDEWRTGMVGDPADLPVRTPEKEKGRAAAMSMGSGRPDPKAPGSRGGKYHRTKTGKISYGRFGVKMPKGEMHDERYPTVEDARAGAKKHGGVAVHATGAEAGNPIGERVREEGGGEYGDIRPGDRITIVNRFGQESTGRVVMRGPAGWVLNMGGRHGTPAIANEENIVRVKRGKRAPDSLAMRRLTQ